MFAILMHCSTKTDVCKKPTVAANLPDLKPVDYICKNMRKMHRCSGQLLRRSGVDQVGSGRPSFQQPFLISLVISRYASSL